MSNAPVHSGRFVFHPTPLEGLWVMHDLPMQDDRGSFSRLYCSADWQGIGLATPVVQINQSMTAGAGTIRGLHFQHPPHAETKAVRCVAGAVFDVAVDVRRGSPTYLQWYGLRLAAGDAKSLIIPPGFAHGFQCLESASSLMYFVTAAFAPQAEDGLHPLDPSLEIAWPMPCTMMSPKDEGRKKLANRSFSGVALAAESLNLGD